MIQLRTVLKPADNSGAKKLMVMGVPGRIGKYAHLGQVVKCVVHGAEPTGNVADQEKVDVVVVRMIAKVVVKAAQISQQAVVSEGKNVWPEAFIP